MRLKINLPFEKIIMECDADVEQYLVEKMTVFKNSPSGLCFINKKGVKIPIWRLARRQFNKAFIVEYKDGNKYNLQRENLILKRKGI